MIISRKLVNEIGLFDPAVPFYYDDSLLSFKTWLAGKRVVNVSDSKVYHVGGDSTTENVTYFTSYNSLKSHICLLFDVYYRFNDLAKALFLFAYAQQQQLLYTVLKNDAIGMYAQAHGLLWAFKHFRHIWQNRLSHWIYVKISPEELLEKFVRVNLPNFGLNLLSSFYRKKYYAAVVEKYERTLRLQ
jgi:GT2 family glycosyltransferase